MPTDSLTFLILLMIAAACGWAVARFGVRSERRKKSAPLSADYLKGVHFLLEDNPDKAIEVFVAMMEVDNETVETHFALGSLFRRRGEVDRAIRIHQNLIARPNLAKSYRDQALYALAEDYLRAGLLDRAEGLFEKLANNSTRQAGATEKLVSIYELQNDWEKAIAARRKLSAQPENERIAAHYFCELAEEALERGDLTAARGQLKSAQAGGTWLHRGAMMRASMAVDAGDLKTARKLYTRIAEEDARFLLEIWGKLKHVLDNVRGDRNFERFLDRLVQRTPSIAPWLTQVALIHEQTELPLVRRGLAQWLDNDATLREALTSIGMLTAGQDIDEHTLERLCAGLGVLLRRRANYLCEACGYVSEQLYWQCPGCRRWDSIRPHLTSNPELFPSLAS